LHITKRYKYVLTFKKLIMPIYKYEFIVNGEIDYTCFSEGCVRMYEFNLDVQGVNYEVVRTCLV
jgi:hypothetical protein